MMEFARLALVYVHLIACCIAIGLVLKSDFVMLKDMLNCDQAASVRHLKQMHSLQFVVAIALAVLWVTGVALVAFDMVLKDGGWNYLANPKMQAKILVVVLLTVNGIVLHMLVMPWLQEAGSIMRMTRTRTALTALTGTISGVSWLCAALLGVGRMLAWKYPLEQLLIALPVLVAGGFVAMMLVIERCKVVPVEWTP